MMQKKIMLLPALLLATIVLGQQNIRVSAGKKCGKLKLGMPEEKVKRLLGNTLKEKSYEEEMTDFWFHNSTLAVDSIPQFVLGFDKCLVLNDSLNRTWPVYKIYILNNKVNFLVVTAYLPDSALARKVLINRQIRFDDPLEKCSTIFGNESITTLYPRYQEYLYHKKGIQLLFSSGRLKTVNLFRPHISFLQLIAARSAAIKSAFQAIDKKKGGTIKWPD